MARTAFAVWLGFVGIAAVAGLAILTQDHGPLGWLNALQQWIFGAYSLRLSILLLLLIVVIGLAPLRPLYRRYFARPLKPVTSGFVAVPGSNAWILVALVLIVPTIWAFGFIWYAWSQHDLRQDLSADYQVIDLTVAPPPDHLESHLAIKGRFVFGASVELSYKYSHPEATFVPIVEPGWVKGRPVRFIARITDVTQVQHDLAVNDNGGRILFAEDGSVPDPTLQLFSEMGVVTNSATMQLRVVPSENGKPLAPVYDAYRPDPFMVYWIVATVLSVLLTLVMVLSYFAQNRHLRARQRAAGPA